MVADFLVAERAGGLVDNQAIRVTTMPMRRIRNDALFVGAGHDFVQVFHVVAAELGRRVKGPGHGYRHWHIALRLVADADGASGVEVGFLGLDILLRPDRVTQSRALALVVRCTSD